MTINICVCIYLYAYIHIVHIYIYMYIHIRLSELEGLGLCEVVQDLRHQHYGASRGFSRTSASRADSSSPRKAPGTRCHRAGSLIPVGQWQDVHVYVSHTYIYIYTYIHILHVSEELHARFGVVINAPFHRH